MALTENINGKICFYAEQYKDYSYGWDNWCLEYTDKDNLGEFITKYQAFDENMEEIFENSLLERK